MIDSPNAARRVPDAVASLSIRIVGDEVEEAEKRQGLAIFFLLDQLEVVALGRCSNE